MTDDLPDDVPAGFADERLEAALVSVGHHLQLPPGLPERAGEDVAWGQRRRARLLAFAAAVVVVAGGMLMVPSARAAIAGMLGIGSTRIEIADEARTDADTLPLITDGLDPISVQEATVVLGWDLPDTNPTALGPADTIYRMPEGGVLLAWNAETATLWLRASTHDADAIVRKLISSSDDVEPVDGIGTEAVMINDAHVLQTPHRRVSASPVLLWYEGDREYRFEAEMTASGMIEFARHLS